MKYVSTRGRAPVLGFADTLLTGLAPDGGLYLPETWPTLRPGDLAAWSDRRYQDIAVDVMAPYVDDAMDATELGELDHAYRSEWMSRHQLSADAAILLRKEGVRERVSAA